MARRPPPAPSSRPVQVLARLLQFARMDLDKLTRLGAWRLARFTVIPLLRTAGSRASGWAEDYVGGGRESPNRPARGLGLWERDPRDALRRLQRHAQARLESARVHRAVPVDPQVREVVRAPDGRWESRLTGNDAQRFDAALTVALLLEGPSLRYCEGCTKPFVPPRKRRYCSDVCNNRSRQGRHRRRHPEKRHQRYEARIRHQHQHLRNARIERRSRSR